MVSAVLYFPFSQSNDYLFDYLKGIKFRGFLIFIFLKKGLEQGIETNVSFH